MIADGEQIRRVIHNIISNAIKYMDKPKGIIQIRIKDVGDFIQLKLKIMERELQQRICRLFLIVFYRTDVSRNSSKGGSGIGLSIVKKDPGGSWRKGLGNQQAWNRHNHVFCT